MLQPEIEFFLTYCANELRRSPLTVKAYKLDLGQFERFQLAKGNSHTLGDISRDDLRSFLGEFQQLKPSSLRRKIATLRSFFRFLQEEKKIDENPAQTLGKGLRKEKLLPKTVSIEDLKKLFAETVDAGSARRKGIILRDKAIIEILFSTGIRVGELCSLDCADLNLDDGFLLVWGKGAKERMVPLPVGKTSEAVSNYIDFRNSLEDVDQTALFLNRDRNRLSSQSIRLLLQKYCKKANISKVTPHLFRHTLATLLLEKGTDIRYIQSLLGHSSITTTTIYASVAQNARNRIFHENHPRPMLG